MDIIWLDIDRFTAALNESFADMTLVRPDGLAAAFTAAQSAHYYGGEIDLLVLATIYAKRVAAAHAFADGNKRSALIACLTFLRLNGVIVQADQRLLSDTIVGLAAGIKTVGQFATVLSIYAGSASGSSVRRHEIDKMGGWTFSVLVPANAGSLTAVKKSLRVSICLDTGCQTAEGLAFDEMESLCAVTDTHGERLCLAAKAVIAKKAPGPSRDRTISENKIG